MSTSRAGVQRGDDDDEFYADLNGILDMQDDAPIARGGAGARPLSLLSTASSSRGGDLGASNARASSTGVSSRRYSNTISNNSSSEFDSFAETSSRSGASAATGPPPTALTSGLGVFTSLAATAAASSSSSTNAAASSRDFLMKPCDKHGSTIYCCVERDKSGFNRLHPYYKCYMEMSGVGLDDALHNSPGNSDRSDLGGTEGRASGAAPHKKLLMSAKKRQGMKSSSYLISMDDNPDRGSESLIGKVKGDSVGSTYTLYDGGLSHSKTQGLASLRCEYGLAKFQFDSGGPCTIQVWLPAMDPLGRPLPWQPTNSEASIEAAVAREGLRGTGGVKLLEKLVNKKPKWDDTYGGHVLNFQGRVTESSVKNFQLLRASDEGDTDEIVLQFGRTGKDSFAMDVRHPLSLYQAFAIVIVCMDDKLADRKGYEYLRMLTISNSSNSAQAGSRTNQYDEDDYNDSCGGGSGGPATLGFKGALSNVKDYFTKERK